MFIGDLVEQPADPSPWRWGEDKIFEGALLEFPEDTPHRWETIAAALPGRSAAEVRKHFEALEEDVDDIEAGRIPLPTYPDDFCQGWGDSWPSRGKHGGEPDRKKGVPWSEEEHRLFLIGLDKYGKGDWRSISRNVVITRTPTQVASHAQKYFLRQNLSIRNDRKRSSIHDITTASHNATNPSHPPPQPSPSPHSLAGGRALPL